MSRKAGANGNLRAVLPKQDRRIVEREVLPAYLEESLGIPVELHEAAHRVRYDDGVEAIEVADLEGLSAAVAMARALMPIKFSAAELKFLRKALGLTGKELANALETSVETVSRWENGQHMGGYVEKNYRLLICSLLKDRAPAVPYKPETIAFMKIKVPADPNFRVPPMAFRRVHLQKMNSPTVEDAWGTSQAAA